MMEMSRFCVMVESLRLAVLSRKQAEVGLANYLGKRPDNVRLNQEAEKIAVELLTESVLDFDGLIEGYIFDGAGEGNPIDIKCPGPCGARECKHKFIISNAASLYDYLDHMYPWRSQFLEDERQQEREAQQPEEAPRISFTAYVIEKTIIATTPE